jgi:thymidylate synthase (FAD)
MIEIGVAKEMARMFLPVNLYTEIYVNCDLNNLMKFLRLRMDHHAQYEIQVYANAMFEIMKELYPWTAEVFKKYKLILKEEENG